MQQTESPKAGRHCRHCGKPITPTAAQIRNRNYLCHECKNAADRAYRADHGQKRYDATYRALHPEKRKAQTKVLTETRAGRLVRQSCVECGNPKTHAHHSDYSKPLEVTWLCETHHKLLHRKAAWGKTGEDSQLARHAASNLLKIYSMKLIIILDITFGVYTYVALWFAYRLAGL